MLEVVLLNLWVCIVAGLKITAGQFTTTFELSDQIYGQVIEHNPTTFLRTCCGSSWSSYEWVMSSYEWVMRVLSNQIWTRLYFKK